MLESVTLLGSSSGRNAGDAALMSGIMDSSDEACGKRLLYEIPTIKPDFVSKTYKNQVKPVSMLPWHLSIKMLGLPTYRSIMRTDLSVIFDAILFDRALYNPLFNFLSTLHYMLPKAKARGAKLAYFNVGIGPIDTTRGKEMLLELSEIMDFMTVRDRDSYDILKDIGVKNPRLLESADAALIVKPSDDDRVNQIIKKLDLQNADEILAINVNSYINTWARPKTAIITKDKFVDTYTKALLKVTEDLKVPLLFVSTQHQDLSITRAIQEKVAAAGRKTALFSNTEYNHFEIKGVLGRASMLFGMRLHSMILGSSNLTPIIGLAYQPKIDHYYTTAGIRDFSMSFSNFSEESLYKHIMHGWENKALIKGQLEKRIPQLQEKARYAARLVQALRNDENLDEVIAGFSKTKEETPQQIVANQASQA